MRAGREVLHADVIELALKKKLENGNCSSREGEGWIWGFATVSDGLRTTFE